MAAFLSDGTVNLRPVTRADLPQLAAWRNDSELRARTREFRPLTDVDQERWLAHISGNDRRHFMFVAEIATDALRAGEFIDAAWPEIDPWQRAMFVKKLGGCSKPIGVVGLCHWDPVNASAEVSFYIGDEAARGKGYASRAVALLERWGFDELHLVRIWAEVYAFNKPSMKLLERLGYQHEGTMRQHVHRGGRRVDAHLYGLLEDEWRALS